MTTVELAHWPVNQFTVKPLPTINTMWQVEQLKTSPSLGTTRSS